jgi:hypothetical protein
MEVVMIRSLLRSASLLGIALALGACGSKNDQANFQASVDSMSTHRDSTIHALDSTGARRPVDTTKLGAAKTESILTKARKTP